MVLRLQSVRRARENERAPLPSVLDVMQLRGFMHASSVSSEGCYALATALHKRNACMGKNPVVRVGDEAEGWTTLNPGHSYRSAVRP